jgi:Domain of unknown function (DUF4389)/zinc-ribbon domain
VSRPSGPARFCTRCGTERLEGARFCIRCGRPFDDTPSAVAAAPLLLRPAAAAPPVDALEPPWASSARPHPLRFSVPRAPRRRRRTVIAPTAILIGQFLLLHFGGKPGLIIFAVFWTAVVAITFLLALTGWLVRIAVGRLPRLLGPAAFGWLGIWARLWAWFGLLVDWSSPPAVQLDPAAGRGLGLIARPLAALPALVIETLWLVPGACLAFVAWIAIVIRGRLPDGVADVMELEQRYRVRLLAYVLCLTDAYPWFQPEALDAAVEPVALPESVHGGS